MKRSRETSDRPNSQLGRVHTLHVGQNCARVTAGAHRNHIQMIWSHTEILRDLLGVCSHQVQVRDDLLFARAQLAEQRGDREMFHGQPFRTPRVIGNEPFLFLLRETSMRNRRIGTMLVIACTSAIDVSTRARGSSDQPRFVVVDPSFRAAQDTFLRFLRPVPNAITIISILQL